MTLYSHNGAAPAPLPFRIRVPAGDGTVSRTDPSTFTVGEIEAAGYVAADAKPDPVGGIPARWHDGAWRSAPSYTAATHYAPVWSGTAWADPVAKSLAELQTAMKAAITERRWAVETGGITLNGAAIATDAATQAKLSGALQLVQDDDTRILDWKGVNGWITLDATAVTAIAVAVGTHVQACFSREKALHTAVDAAENPAGLAVIDVQSGAIIVDDEPTGGWPSNG